MIDPYLETRREPGGYSRPNHEPDREYEITILQLLEQHGAAEGKFLESYEAIAERSDTDEAVQYLIRLILDDERRHHKVFDEMANAIRSFMWEVPVEPQLPAISRRSNPELLAETERLLKFEKKDAKELRALKRALKGGQKSSLDPLMVELMLHDTAKHIAILKHIKRYLKS